MRTVWKIPGIIPRRGIKSWVLLLIIIAVEMAALAWFSFFAFAKE